MGMPIYLVPYRLPAFITKA